MKKLLLLVFVLSCAGCGYAEPRPADDILAFVRSQLPDEPLELTGSLIKTAQNNHRTRIPVKIELDWGAAAPEAKYHIGEESLTISWNNEQPSYTFSNPKNKPTSRVLDTGITWADLSFSVLWWPDAKLIDEGKKLNRDCYIVDVPVPGSEKTMRLWIEKKMGMLLEARTLDAKQRELTRLKIVSIKKMDGMWIAKDLELKEYNSKAKTTLEIADLQWKNGPPQQQEEEMETAVAFDTAESVNTLAIDLYAKLAGENDGNLFFSPYSISSALAMTYAGARGETAEQMNDTLHFGGPGATHPAFSYLRKTLNSVQDKGQVELSVANALWPQKDYTFLPDYLAITKEFYGSEIRPVDYASDAGGARRKINTWVEDQTNDKIQDLIAEGVLDALTRFVLVNAIYFKGDWAEQFKTENTRPAPFTLSDGSQIDVPMMSQTGDFKLAQTETIQALELPYAGHDLSMIILLPASGKPLKLVPPETLEFREREVAVQLPSFKINSSFGLKPTLSDMGMPLAFDPDRADFSGMNGNRDLYIGAVLHKAFVEVNEEGTEAAAATAVVMLGSASLPPQFIANRPFLFLVRENATDTILFMGRIMDPR